MRNRSREQEELKKLISSINERPITRDEIITHIRTTANLICIQLESATKIEDVTRKTADLDTIELIELGLKLVEVKISVKDFVDHLKNLG